MTAAAAPSVPAPTTIAARAVGLTKVYGQGDTAVKALDAVSVDFASGEFSAIMGPSGSGKSTLMHCMAGLDRVTAGQVYIGDAELSHLPDKELTRLRRDQVGFIFQAYNLVPTLNALENITLPMDIAGRDPDQAWLDQLIDTIGLRPRLSHTPSQLSGGQQQRVAAARALAGKPAIVFADEPTGALDTASAREALGLLRGLREQTIVMVTHDPVAAGYAQRVVFLVDGRIMDEMRDPTPDRVLDKMKTLGD